MSFQPGEWVEVKSFAEIAATLDENGTLEGMPFMPEMIDFCGKRFRFARYVAKTCVEQPVGRFIMRGLAPEDIALLDDTRCSGADHDGCQRECTIFWKTAWLKPAGSPQENLAAHLDNVNAKQNLLARLKTKVGPDQYFCQSTELLKLVEDSPMGPKRVLQQCLRDLRSGAVGISEMLPLVFVPLYRKIRDSLFGRPLLKGNLTKTPVGELNLRPGELVEVKSLEEIRATLDGKGRNRGLVCDIESTVFCGKRFRVRSRLDRMISEPTGQMRKVDATVVLEGQGCLCARALGGCPRKDFAYWREIWLKRVEQADTGAS